MALISLVTAACSPAESEPDVAGGGAGSGGGVQTGAGTGAVAGSPPASAGFGGAGEAGSKSFGGSSGTVGGGGIGGASGAAGSFAGGGAGGSGGSGANAGGGASGANAGGGAGGAPDCAGAGFVLCEDFESTAPGTNPPQGWTKSGAISIVEDEAHRGRRSLRVEAAASGARRIVRDVRALGSFGGTHWGRLFYKVRTPAPVISGYLHSTLVAGSGTGPLDRRLEMRVVDTVQDPSGRHQFLYNVQLTGAGEFGKGSSYDYRYENVWRCAEWRVDAATQSYRFYYEGNEVTQIAIDNGAGNFANSEIPSVLDTIAVGWNNYQNAGTGFVAWIDDVALDEGRISCAR